MRRGVSPACCSLRLRGRRGCAGACPWRRSRLSLAPPLACLRAPLAQQGCDRRGLRRVNRVRVVALGHHDPYVLGVRKLRGIALVRLLCDGYSVNVGGIGLDGRAGHLWPPICAAFCSSAVVEGSICPASDDCKH